MELIKGVELIEFFNNASIARLGLDDKYCRYIFKKVCYALHGLHHEGYAHRDLKPENIMITDTFNIKVIDLGMSLNMSGRTGDFLMNTRLGTKGY